MQLTCDLCGRIGTEDDAILPGHTCQEPCNGTVRFYSIADVADAVRDGHTVYWRHTGYYVNRWESPTFGERFDVVCDHNDHTVGLFHRDGVTSDYDPADFFID